MLWIRNKVFPTQKVNKFKEKSRIFKRNLSRPASRLGQPPAIQKEHSDLNFISLLAAIRPFWIRIREHNLIWIQHWIRIQNILVRAFRVRLDLLLFCSARGPGSSGACPEGGEG